MNTALCVVAEGTHFSSVRVDALRAAERAGHFALRPALGFGTHH